MAFTETLSDFFNADTPGYAAASWNSTTVDGIFDKEFELAELGDIGVEGTAPVFTCALSDIVGIAQGQAFVVGGVNYTVVRAQPDGTGVSTVILRKV